MRTLVFKGKDRLWPTVTWEGSSLSIQYLGLEDEDVSIVETNSIDFEDFFLHLDKGGSIFVTVKPDTINQVESSFEESDFRLALRRNLPSLAKTMFENEMRFSHLNNESGDVKSWK